MKASKRIGSSRRKPRRPDAKTTSKKPKGAHRVTRKELVQRRPAKANGKQGPDPLVLDPVQHQVISTPTNDRHVFSFQVESISGETTIGDLIVAFPRTRDILMKHGLRFDVEDAGYLYMTLNIFSAINGLTSHDLIQELHAIAREPPPPPLQSIRPIAATPTQ